MRKWNIGKINDLINQIVFQDQMFVYDFNGNIFSILDVLS